jgi:iron complex transport system substrate-binding protein
MRIVSLLPGATEIVAALGAEPWLVGVSHECDHPAGVRGLPRVTWSAIDGNSSSAGIDAQVRAARAAGRPVIAIDAATLSSLRPDVIVTQTLCEVCAVSDGVVYGLAGVMPTLPHVIALSGRTLGGIESDVRALGLAIGRTDAAGALVRDMRERFQRLMQQTAARATKPRVLCVEWLDPPFLAGHWVPELVALAGGVDALTRAGSHSVQISWETIDRTEADVVLVLLCGFGVERAFVELTENAAIAERLRARGCPIWIMDGNAYTSRPGPRLVEAAECMAAALDGSEYPGLVRFQ